MDNKLTTDRITAQFTQKQAQKLHTKPVATSSPNKTSW